MSSPNSALERNVKRICSKLRAISQLRFGDKWNSTTQKAEPVTPLTRFIRWGWYWNESKENSINDFTIIFEEAYVSAFEIITIYPLSETSYQNDLAHLLRDLTEQIADTKMAMIRQKGTYSGSDETKQQLDKIITYITEEAEKVAAKVKEVGILLPNPKAITAASPSRLNPVHIPVAKSPVSQPSTPAASVSPPKSVVDEKKDNISNALEIEESDAINVEFEGYGSGEEEAF